MVTTQSYELRATTELNISWESLPDDFPLEEEPVENTSHPMLAGALKESLELHGDIKPDILIGSNLGICTKVNDDLVIKAPDWFYVAYVKPLEAKSDRKSYTPHLEGDVPTLVMEFLSDTDGSEYSVKRTYPPGKWFFYEQILRIPIYVIFNPTNAFLEVYRLKTGRYELQSANSEGRYLISEMGLFLGVWQGTKEERTGYWLRWWDESGNPLLWAVELLDQERQRAESEHQRAESERQRADKLAAYLLSQGISPDQINEFITRQNE